MIIRFSSIGDIVLTTPVVRVLSQQMDTEIHFLTKPAFASILQSNPYISKVITLAENFEQMTQLLRSENYDIIIDLHHNLRSARLKLALGKPSSVFNKLNFEKWLMVNFKIDRLPDVHIVDRYMRTIQKLGGKNDHKGLDFFIPPERNVDTKAYFGFEPMTYAAIAVGAAHETKCMSADQIIALCRWLDMPTILMGGKQEREKADIILDGLKESQVRSACGAVDLFQSASILQQAATIVSHDTGLMHIAAALKKPQIVVWGNTIPGFGMYPYYGNLNIPWLSFERHGLPCRPCTKLGYRKCPKGHFKCMLDHDVQKIADSARKLVNSEW